MLLLYIAMPPSTCNVCPVMTDVLSDEIKEQMKSQIPLGTFGSVQDIANAVVFLAND